MGMNRVGFLEKSCVGKAAFILDVSNPKFVENQTSG
jgi:hypothetical protein